MAGDLELAKFTDKRLWVPFGAMAGLLLVATAAVAWFNGKYLTSEITRSTDSKFAELSRSVEGLKTSVELRFKDVEYAIKDARNDIDGVEKQASLTRSAADTWIKLFRATNAQKFPDLVVPDLPE